MAMHAGGSNGETGVARGAMHVSAVLRLQQMHSVAGRSTALVDGQAPAATALSAPPPGAHAAALPRGAAGRITTRGPAALVETVFESVSVSVGSAGFTTSKRQLHSVCRTRCRWTG
jgi:hypothetical protein